MKFNLNILNKYLKDGRLINQTHPTLPLIIWNYGTKTQYDNLWDDITTQTRGLVTDDKGNIVARPFKKFFNDSEKKHTPTPDFDVYDKLEHPYFPVTWSKESEDYLGEDINFCMALRKAGYTITVDDILSRQLNHIGAFAFGHDLVQN
jgi:hypothetical protein